MLFDNCFIIVTNPEYFNAILRKIQSRYDDGKFMILSHVSLIIYDRDKTSNDMYDFIMNDSYTKHDVEVYRLKWFHANEIKTNIIMDFVKRLEYPKNDE